ncbi:recombinase family protein [Chloroflexota bacterium]
MKAALYARVSSEEQVEGYSIDAQKRAFRTLCQNKNWVPIKEYIELGRSAHTDDIRKRPVFQESIADALAGKYDVLVVHKIDRFSRKLKVTLEYFEKLGKAGIGFVSIQNDMDYSTPTGKFMLVMQGGLAELYSDNLSQETKKGWHERRRQGYYCGTLPFGAIKNDENIPVPDIRERIIEVNGNKIPVKNYDGLLLSFKLGAQGKTDREITNVLNTAGYRTTGTHGPRPFSRDTVRRMLTNRFYLGYIPDGNEGWLKAKHDAFINKETWERAQITRKRNIKARINIPKGRSVSSLTGLMNCTQCLGRMNINEVVNGRRRVACYNRSKGWDCSQTSGYLDIYESQIRYYLKEFHIPEDYRDRIIKSHQKINESPSDNEIERANMESRLQRLKDLYSWGDITRDQYITERDKITERLHADISSKQQNEVLDKLADFLGDVSEAWDVASQEQRNRLCHCIFQEVWIRDKAVIAVRPQPELKPFFDMNQEAMDEKLSHIFGKWRPRPDLNRRSPP